MASKKNNSESQNGTAPETQSPPEVLLPVGIDLGSLYARVAIGEYPSSIPSNSSHGNLKDNNDIFNMVSNAQGTRCTISMSTPETAQDESPASSSHFIFGEAARRHLIRNCGKDPNDYLVSETENLAASAFFNYLCGLACDASSSRPSGIRCVVSVPSHLSPAMAKGILEQCDSGIKSLIGDREGKNKKKKMKQSADLVLGVISDAAAVCIAHGLSDATCFPSESTNGNANHRINEYGAPVEWKKCLVVDWGASGLTLTSFSHQSNMLIQTDSKHVSTCSGTHIIQAVVKHLIQLFEQKYRFARNQVAKNKKATEKLITAATSAVKSLSIAGGASTAQIMIDGLFEGEDLNVTLSKPRFDMLCSNFLKIGDTHMKEFVASMGSDLDVLLLSGNVCQLASVRNLIDSNSKGKNLWRGNDSISVEECIAIGCAVQAQYVCTENDRQQLLKLKETKQKSGTSEVDGLSCHDLQVPVTPFGIGISSNEKAEDEPLILIDMGTPLPAHISKEITLSKSSSTYTLSIVQKTKDAPTKVIAEINDFMDGMELTVELTGNGKLKIAVDGGDTVLI